MKKNKFKNEHDELFLKLGEFLNEHAWLVGKAECIQGAGLGYKFINGKPTDQPAIIFYVSHKVPIRQLPVSSVIPSKISIPDPYNDGKPIEIVTDVEESGEFFLQGQMHRPVHGGEEIVAGFRGSGTLGCIVQDMTVKNRKEMVVLSNAHVLGQTAGVNTYSPRPSGKGNEQIGVVKRGYPIDWSRFSRNVVDAAIASVDVELSFDFHHINGGIRGTYLASGNDTRNGGLRVQKSGNRTQHTTGRIRTMRTFAITRNKFFNVQTARFINQIVIEGDNNQSFSDHGDSGSVVMTMDNRIFGLLMAGSRTMNGPRYSVCNPIQAVEYALQVKVIRGQGKV